MLAYRFRAGHKKHVNMDTKMISMFKCVALELVGTFVFVFVGLGSVQGFKASGAPGSAMFAASPGFGLGLAAAIYATGGHLNPAISLAATAFGKISPIELAAYVLAQLIGATLAAGILYGGTPDSLRGSLGSTTVSGRYTQGQAFLLEITATAVLAFVVWSTAINQQTPTRAAPLAIGLTVLGLHLLLVATTGASMNPARSFGPSLVSGVWKDGWIYWIAPLLGALLGAGLHEAVHAFKPREEPAIIAQ